ncbi:MAG: hypothetical protein U1F26_18250 [Lysobacterales bacterium]
MGVAWVILAADGGAPQNWQLLALDVSAQTAVFVGADEQLRLVHVHESLADSGFTLHAVQPDQVTLQLKRSYQGLVLQQTLALGARLDPEAVAQMEAADQRAARAESLIMTPVEPVKPPRHP